LAPPPGPPPPRARRAGPLGALAARAAGVEALAWRHARLTAAGGPLAYFWIVVEPAIPIFFITALYLLLGRFEVFDMPTPAFVSLGVGAWFVFRAVFVRLSAGHGADAQLLRLPRVTEFDLFASKTLFVVVLYAIMLAALLGGMVAAGWAPPPERPLAVLGLLGCMAVSGFGLGLTYCLLMRRFPPLLKVRMILLRVLYVTSGAMYVTEQLPDFVTDWLKLNPFLHVVQLTRAAWFPLYETTAVSLSVALWATAASLLAGLASLRVLSRAPRSP
jgi:capsular polysaccharide transport system permease protein